MTKKLHLATLIIALAMLATACSSAPGALVGDIATLDAEPGVEESSAAASAVQRDEPTVSAEQPAAPTETAPASVVVQGDVDQQDATVSVTTSQVLATGGAVDEINGFELAVFETTYTTSSPHEFITSEGGSDGDESWLITEFIVTNDPATRLSLEESNLTLQGPDGVAYTADEVYDAVGIRFPGTLAGLRSLRVFAAFDVPAAITSLDGWNLVVDSQSGGIPNIMPLSGSAYAHNYPLALPDGAQSSFSTGTWASCNNDEQFSSRVIAASMSVEGLTNRDDFERMTVGERIFDIALDVEGVSEDTVLSETFSSCGSVHVWPAFVLRADGRPIQPFRRDTPDIDSQATFTLDLGYRVPAGTTTIELTGGTDANVLASWDIALPVAVGEPGAELIPFRNDIGVPTAPAPDGDRPATLTSIAVAEGGASGVILRSAVTIGDSTATNADLESFIAGAPVVDDDGRTHVIVEVDVENLVDQRRTFSDYDFVLENPRGRVYGATELFDRRGDSTDVGLSGLGNGSLWR